MSPRTPQVLCSPSRCDARRCDPQVDGVSFGDVGGLDHYIRALKEMVFLPLARPTVLVWG